MEDIPRSLLPMTDAEVLTVQRITVTPAQRLIVALVFALCHTTAISYTATPRTCSTTRLLSRSCR
jgi:hypothetical protein